jgi:hypothetical protein
LTGRIDFDRLKRMVLTGDLYAIARVVRAAERTRSFDLMQLAHAGCILAPSTSEARHWGAMLVAAQATPMAWHDTPMWKGVVHASGRLCADREEEYRRWVGAAEQVSTEEWAKRLVSCERFEWDEGLCNKCTGWLVCDGDNPGDMPGPEDYPDLDHPSTWGVLFSWLIRDAGEGVGLLKWDGLRGVNKATVSWVPDIERADSDSVGVVLTRALLAVWKVEG